MSVEMSEYIISNKFIKYVGIMVGNINVLTFNKKGELEYINVGENPTLNIIEVLVFVSENEASIIYVTGKEILLNNVSPVILPSISFNVSPEGKGLLILYIAPASSPLVIVFVIFTEV